MGRCATLTSPSARAICGLRTLLTVVWWYPVLSAGPLSGPRKISRHHARRCGCRPIGGLESSGQGAKRADAHGSRYITDLGYEWSEQRGNERALCAGTNYEPLTIKDAPMYNLNMGIMGITINTNCHLNESGSRNRARPIELTERKGGALIALP